MGRVSLRRQDVLEKLRPLHLLPGVILEWRRITNAMTKVVFPLQREKRHHPGLAMDRIHPIAQTHTATGNDQRHIWAFLCIETLHAFFQTSYSSHKCLHPTAGLSGNRTMPFNLS
jgi:hypothetical protein